MAEQDQAVFVYATFPDLAVAEEIAGAIVGARLAACANILPGMVSVYRWEGKIERDSEVVAVFKTLRPQAHALIREGVRLHPYDTPAFVILPLEGGDPRFLSWLTSETDCGVSQ